MHDDAAPTAEPAAPPLRILLVEDDEFDVAVFNRAFRRSEIPCEIVRCRTGEEAIAGLTDAELELDLLVTDHQLPGLSGFDLCLKLLDRFRLPSSGESVPPFALVLLTGVGSEQMAIRALRAGINDYIVKDASKEYLELLPLVLPRVARRYRQQRRRNLTAQELEDTQATPSETASGARRLGLPACAEAVRQRAGRIWVENGAGQAPTLHFSVPLAPDEVEFWTATPLLSPSGGTPEASLRDPTPPSAIAVTDSGGEPSDTAQGPVDEHSQARQRDHVLIVHPNPIVTFVTRRTAERSGRRVAAVENGDKAIEALEREPFDLVLMAPEMPKLDGLETTRRIRQREDGSAGRVPILALGAAGDATERCREAGMDGTVSSPVSAQGLKAALERLG